MRVLGINTVGDVCEAALVSEAGVLAVRSEPMSQGHDARLAPLVAELLQEAGVAPKELDRIAVIAGPGSFTGVRVGVAFARGLALAIGKPAVGVSSLEAMEAMANRDRVLALLPAKRRPPERTWWAQIVNEGRGEGEPVEADATAIAKLEEGVVAVCGGLDDVPDSALTRINSRPTAEAAARRVLMRGANDLPTARPIYVREPDAAPFTGAPILKP